MVDGIDADDGVERLVVERQLLARVDDEKACALCQATLPSGGVRRRDAVLVDVDADDTAARLLDGEERGPPEPLATS